MNRNRKYKFLHYDIIVLLTVVLVFIGIHFVDFYRLYPEALKARYGYVQNHVSTIRYQLELRSDAVFDRLTEYSLLYADYIYDPDSVYRFCEILASSVDRIEAVAVVPSASIYKGHDLFVPMYIKQISDHAFNGIKLPYVDSLLAVYSLDTLICLPNGSLDLVSDPILLNVKPDSHVCLLNFPVMKENKIDANVIAAISLDKLTDFIDGIKEYKGSEVYLISRSGLFMTNPDKSKIGTSIGDFFLDSYGQVAQNTIDSTWISNNVSSVEVEDGVFCTSGSIKNYWSVFYYIPFDELFVELRSDLFFVFFTALMGVLVIILVCIYNIKLASEQRANQSTMDRELEIASSIQKSMIHKPVINSLDVDARLRSAKVVGGDLYFYTEKNGKLIFCVGDVTGKGVPASLLMSRMLTLLNIFSKNQSSPAKICSAINREISADNTQFHFITLFLGILDIDTGCLKYCNAGHDEPIYNGRYLKTSDNMPLGVIADQQFLEGEMMLEDNSFFTIYTDGITEAMGPLNEIYGPSRFIESISSITPSSALELDNHILSCLKTFVGKEEQSDDATLLTIHYLLKP